MNIPDHVGRAAVKLVNEDRPSYRLLDWPGDKKDESVITVAKLLMNPPAPMTDPDEEAAKRVVAAWFQCDPTNISDAISLARVTEQMRKEREAWDAGQRKRFEVMSGQA